MKELLTYVARNLVEHPDQVTVTETVEDGETVLELEWQLSHHLMMMKKEVLIMIS